MAAHDILGPLTTYDGEHNADLVQTLRIYFDANGNVSKASDRLFLHRNGLLYRLGRIEEILRLSLSNPHQRIALELAVRITETCPEAPAG